MGGLALAAAALVVGPAGYAQQQRQGAATAAAATTPGGAASLRRPSRRLDWQISGGAGTSQTLSSDLHIVQPATGTDATFHGVRWQGHPYQGSPYHEVRIVAFLPRQPRLGVFVNFTHYKIYALTGEERRVTGTWLGQPIDQVAPLGDRVQYFRISNGVNVFTEGVLFRQQLQRSARYPSGRLQPYYGGGVSQYIDYGINTVNGQDNNPHRYQWNGWGFSLDAGVRYNLVPHVAGYVEGRYTNGNGHVKIADGGYGATPLHTFHLSYGLSFDF